MLKLTREQSQIHSRAVALATQYKRIEGQLIFILQEVDRTKLFKRLGRSSLFQYAVMELKLSEAVAYAFINVARKCVDVPQLKDAIQTESLSVTKAARMTAAITTQNASALIEFGKTHTAREIDFEVARLNPGTRKNDRVKPVTEDQIQITITVSRETYENLKRLQTLKGPSDLGKILEVPVAEYLERHDPVKKAERTKLCTYRVPSKGRLKAAEKHAVNIRDKGRCTHIDKDGNRCPNERWLHVHHIKPKSEGGTNDPENLTTLCAFHHDLVHQMALPGLLKDREIPYSSSSSFN